LRIDARNQQILRVDAQGYVTQTIYDAFGNAEQITHFANAVQGTIDGSISPAIVDAAPTDPNSLYVLRDSTHDQITTLQYDERNLKTQITDALGYTQHFTYDALGNVTSTTDKAGNVTTYSYDLNNQLVAQTNPLGIITAYQYDERGNRIAMVEAQGTALERTTEYQYDAANRLTDITRADGKVTHYVLDARGNILEQHDAFGTSEERITRHVYDALNRVIQDTDPLGVVTTYGYDAVGNRIEKTSAVGLPEERTESCDYDANNRITAEYDGQGNTTQYSYDFAGNLTQKSIGSRSTQYEYDGNDRVTAVVDGIGTRTEYHYDAFGDKVETIQAAGIGGQERHTLYAYDLDNRLIATTDAMGSVTQYQYDALGNQTQITDANGGIQHNTFDVAGRLLSTLSAGGILTVNTYDIRGNILSTTQSFADGSDARTTRYTYDVLDRKTAITDGEGFTTSIQYDLFGNQTHITIGQYLVAANDPSFDASKAARAHAESNTFTYDADNRMLSMIDGEGNVTAFTYDAIGNRTSKTEAANTQPRTTTYQYDLANHLVEVDTPEGGVTHYAYSSAGDKTDEWIDRGDSTIHRSFTYDGNGRMTSMTVDPNGGGYGYNYGYGECGGYGSYGVTTRYDYDAVGNLLETEYAVYGSGYHTTTSEYDLNNRKTADIDGEGNRTTYAYDNLGNRILVTDALGNAAHYYYDDSHRLIGLLTPEGAYTSFGYDSAGNQTVQHQYATLVADPSIFSPDLAVSSAADRITTTQYDRTNHAVSVSEPDGSTTQKTYDGAGNLIHETLFANTTAPRQRSYTYDLDNRLVQFTDVDGTQTYFTWDGANNKTSERIVSATDPNAVRETQYRYDLNNRLIEKIFDPNGLNIIQQTAYDLAGNVVSTTDGKGNVTQYYYDFANRLSQTIDAVGNTTYYGYNDAGNRISVSTTSDYETFVGTSYNYDRDGRISAEYKSYVSTFTIKNGWGDAYPMTQHYYDALGNEVQTIDPMGNKTTRYFDSSGHKIAELSADNVLTEWQYDAFGNAVTQTVYMTRLTNADQDPDTRPTPPAGESRTTTTQYDIKGRVVHVTYPAVDVTSVSVNGANSPTAAVAHVAPEERTIYDAFGNAIETIDKAGNHTYSYFDVNGRCIAKVDAMGYMVEWDYDQQGNVIEQRTYAQPLDVSNIQAGTRPTPPSGDVYTVSREYDAASHLIAEYSPAVGVHDGIGADSTERILTTYEYDAAGNQISRTIAAGTAQASTEYYYYDASNRKIAVLDAHRVITTFAYDAVGNVTQTKRFANPLSASVDPYSLTNTSIWGFQHLVASAPNGDQETDFSWDVNNNLIEQKTLGAGAAGTYADIQYGYDLAGRRTWSRNQGSQPYAYNDNTNATQLEYDAMGRVTRTIMPDGTSTVSEYDAAGNLIYQYIGSPLVTAVIGGVSMYFDDAEVNGIDWNYGPAVRQISFTNLPDLSSLGGGDIRIDFHLDSWGGERSNQSFSGGDYQFTFAEGQRDSGTLSFMEGGIDNREHYPINDGPAVRTGSIAIYKTVNGVAVAIGDKVPVTFDRTYSYWTAGGGSRDYRYSAEGSVVTKYNDSLAGDTAVTPATSIAANYDSANGISIAWSASQYAKSSWIVWDTVSHSDASSYAAKIDAELAGNSAVIPAAAVSTGQILYFRVASSDANGNVVYSREESTTVPPVVHDIQVSRVGASGIHVVATPPAGVQNLLFYYGNPGGTNTQVAMVQQANGTYAADVASIPSLNQKNYRIVWADAAGNQYSTSEHKFVNADEHLTATTSIEQNAITNGGATTYTMTLGTQIPSAAAQQYSYMKVVWKNSDIPNAPTHEAIVFGGTVNHDGTTLFTFSLGSNAETLIAGHYAVTLEGVLPDNGSGTEAKVIFDEFTLDVGSATTSSIRQTLSWAIPAASIGTTEQWVLIDGVAVAARRDTTGTRLLVSPTTLTTGNHDYQVFYGEQIAASHTVDMSSAVASSGYDVAVSVTLDPAEVSAIGGHTLTLSWRSPASGEGFANALNLTSSGNVFSGTVAHLVAGNYEAKLSYLDATGREVIVDLLRFSPQDIVQNIVTPPPATINIGTRVNIFNERSNGFVGYANSVFSGDDSNPSYGVKGSIANNTLIVNGNTFTIGELQIIDHSDVTGQWKEFVLGFNEKSANFSGAFSIKDANGSVLFSANFSDLKRQVLDGPNGTAVVQYYCNSIVGNNSYYAGLTGDFLSTVNAAVSINFDVTGMAKNGVPISRSGNSFVATSSETDGTITAGYDVAVSAALTDAQLAAVNGRPVYLSWQQTSPAQGAINNTLLSVDGSQYFKTLPLFAEGNYQLQLYYTNGSNQKVVLDSLTISATTVGFNQSTNSTVVISKGGDDVLTVDTDSVVTISSGFYAGVAHDNNPSLALTIHDTGNGAFSKSIDGRSAGYYVENRYNANNQLIGTNAGTGVWRTYGLDAAGNQVATYEYGVENNTTVHDSYAVFDARNRKVADYSVAVAVDGAANPERLVTQYTYDALDRQVTQVDNAGRSLSRQYSAMGRLLSETDSLNNTTVHWYDRLGNETKTRDPLLNTTNKYYDAAGELIREVDGAGNETDYTYDSFGRKTQVKLVGPNRTITSQTIAYDQADRVVSTTDALGHTISFGYDEQDDRIYQIDASGHRTNFEYDAMGRLINTNYDQSGINIGGLFARHWEDRLYYETNPVVHTQVNLRRQYDSYGNLVLEIDGNGQPTQHVYGAFAHKSEDIDISGSKTHYEYDSFGNLVHEYSDTGKNIWRSYDALNRLVSVQDVGIGVTTTYAYDLAGNRVRETTTGVVNSTDGSTHNRDITYSYDLDGRMTRWSDSVTGMHLNYQWDADGNQKRVYTDAGYANPVDHWYTYDSANRLISETNGPAGSIINAYSYDAFGNRASWNNGSYTTTYQYDDAGRVISADWSNNGNFHATWQYDTVGNMLRYQVYKDGVSQWYIANLYTNTGLNFLTQKVNGTGANEEDEVYALWNTYDADGRQLTTVQRSQTDDKHMLIFNHSYYANGLEKSIHGSGHGYYPSDTLFTYDVDGNLIRQDMSQGTDMDRPEFKTFTYNTDGQILSSFHDTGRGFSIEAGEFEYADGNEVGQRSATSDASPDVSDVSPVELDANGKVITDELGNPIPVDVHAIAQQRFNAQIATEAQHLSNAISHTPGQVSAPGATITESLDSGSVSPLKNFDENTPSNSVTMVTVIDGDTLQSIAARVYGNANLWFVLADANGLDGSQQLKAGTKLLVPNTIKNGRLDSNAHVVYNQSAIVGSNLPNLKAKPQSSGCGSIFAIIIIVIIAIVAAIITDGASLAVTSEMTAAEVAATVATDVAIGAAVYAAANVVQQGILIAMGYQHGFSWSQVGKAAEMGAVNGVAAGITKGLETAQSVAQMGDYAKVADAAVRVTANVGTQFIQNGQITSWSSLAMSGMQGYFGFDDRVIANEDVAALTQAGNNGATNLAYIQASANSAQTAAGSISRNLNMLGPWLNAAESYARGNDYKAENWVGAVGQTLGTAYAEPGSNNSDAFYRAAAQTGKDLLIAGALHVLNKNAGDTYLENAVGQDIGSYLGRAANGYIQPTPTSNTSSRAAGPKNTDELVQDAEQTRADNNQRDYEAKVITSDGLTQWNTAKTPVSIDAGSAPTLNIAADAVQPQSIDATTQAVSTTNETGAPKYKPFTGDRSTLETVVVTAPPLSWFERNIEQPLEGMYHNVTDYFANGHQNNTDYYSAMQDRAVAEGSFPKYIAALAGKKAGDIFYGVTDTGNALINNPAGGVRGVVKAATLNFGPELFNSSANLLKTSLDGYSLAAEQLGLVDQGAFAGFRATDAYNLDPVFNYNNDAERGGAKAP